MGLTKKLLKKSFRGTKFLILSTILVVDVVLKKKVDTKILSNIYEIFKRDFYSVKLSPRKHPSVALA
jgi:hypothetical protein